MSGGVSYYSHNARGESSDLELDGQPYDEPGYLTDLLSNRAVDQFHTCHTVERPMFWRMKHRDQRAYRLGSWKYLKVDTYEYLFDIDTDARERANQAKRQPQRLRAMRDAYEAWHAQIPAVPDDERVGLVFSVADMPSR